MRRLASNMTVSNPGHVFHPPSSRTNAFAPPKSKGEANPNPTPLSTGLPYPAQRFPCDDIPREKNTGPVPPPLSRPVVIPQLMTFQRQTPPMSHSTLNSTEVKVKKKITYALPSQCMEKGHFYVVLGEDADPGDGRFKILSLLGQGTFGKVVECWDRKRKQFCAVKIVRNIMKYTRDAAVEVQYMQQLALADPKDTKPFIKPWKSFLNAGGHMCIVMPRHGPCILEILQRYGPFSMSQIADLAFQMGQGLDFLHTTAHLVHTDLKPENILLYESGYKHNEKLFDAQGVEITRPLYIRICDLGGCSEANQGNRTIVTTRHYRAPEVVLGLGWIYPTDMWSVGCILWELLTGKLLFDTHDNLEHLHLMERILGPLPPHWGKQCSDEAKSFFAAPSLTALLPPAASSSVKLSRLSPLYTTVKEHCSDETLVQFLYSLLSRLFEYEPALRMTAKDLSEHPFVALYSSLYHQQSQSLK